MKPEMFGPHLKRVLKAHNWTQAKLASEVGVSSETVSQWLKCKKYPDFKHLLLIAEKMKLRVGEVVGPEDSDPIASEVLALMSQLEPTAKQEVLSGVRFVFGAQTNPGNPNKSLTKSRSHTAAG